MSESIVKASNIIKRYLKERFTELELTAEHVAKDAQEQGICLYKQQLSRYFNNKDKGYPSEEIIVWLCFRYCIDVRLWVKKMPYNEEEAITKVKKFFG